MKWKGTVAQSWSSCITARFAAAKTPQRSSGSRCCAMREAVSGMADGLHDAGTELGAQAADIDVDDVGARVEGAAPDLLEQLRARADLALLERQVLEQQELARREGDRAGAGVDGAPVRVEGQPAGAQQAVAAVGARL